MGPRNLHPLLLAAVLGLVVVVVGGGGYNEDEPPPVPAGVVVDAEEELELLLVLVGEAERAPRAEEVSLGEPRGGEAWLPGRLLEAGRLRALRLGRALRRRYDGFLKRLPVIGRPRQPGPMHHSSGDGSSSAADVLAYSFGSEGCRATLRHLLEGLYQGEEGPRRKTTTVRSPPGSLDGLMNLSSCTAFQEEMRRVERSEEVRESLAKYEGLYKYVAEKTGLRLDEARPDRGLRELYDYLELRRSLNSSLPDWCPEPVLELLRDVAYLHYNLESSTVALRRLNAGPLLLRFLEGARPGGDAGGGRGVARAKLQLYVGEARHVAALARGLGKRFPRVPGRGSALVLERSRGPGQLVRLLVWTGGTSERLLPVRLADCGAPWAGCTIGEFCRIVEPVLPAEEETRCLLEDAAAVGPSGNSRG